jgi:hypothetical protein
LEGDPTPLAGATVRVVGTTTMTTSGIDGSFSLEAPVGIGVFLTTAAGAWGELVVGDVPAAGIDIADAEVVPDELVADIADALGETIDPTKAMVVVEFDLDVAAGGETADLGATYGFAFVINADDEPVLGNQLIAGGETIVLFANGHEPRWCRLLARSFWRRLSIPREGVHRRGSGLSLASRLRREMRAGDRVVSPFFLAWRSTRPAKKADRRRSRACLRY